MNRPLACCAALALAITASAQVDVIVVDAAGGPGADYTSIAPALAVAQPGDVLLLRTGTYAEALIGLGVVLQGDVGSVVDIGRIVVSSVPLGQTVVVRDVDVAGVASGPALDVVDCDGSVRLEGCTIAEGAGLGAGGARVRDSAAVAFDDCRLGGSLPSGMGSVASLFLLRSHATVHDSLVAGVDGLSWPLGPTPGTPGVEINGGSLFVQGSVLLGGDGGHGVGALPGADGGAGLFCSGMSPDVDVLGSQLVGGQGGTSTGGAGNDGVPSLVFSGSVTHLPGQARSTRVPSPRREGEPVTLRYAGAPGDLVLALYSPGATAPLTFWQLDGPLLIGPHLVVLFAGTVPPTGMLLQNGVTPQLPLGFLGQTFHIQSVFIDGTPQAISSSPSVVTVLDSSL